MLLLITSLCLLTGLCIWILQGYSAHCERRNRRRYLRYKTGKWPK